MPKILIPATLPKYSSAPSGPEIGMMYFNTTDDSTYVYTTINSVNQWMKLGGKLTCQTYTTPGSYTWTRPENVQWIKAVVVIGAGGGGGAGAIKTGDGDGKKAATGGGGGGGGSIAIGYDIYIGDISTISINVPSGGAGGVAHTFSKAAGAGTNFNSNPANAGSAGSGNATFGSYISCPPGSGGGGGLTSAGSTTAAGGAGGAAGAAPTITGIYSYSSSAGSAGGAGAGIVTSLAGSGSISSTSDASKSAGGSTTELGMNRIQWSTSTLGVPSGLQVPTISAGTFTTVSGSAAVAATGFSVAGGGNGGPSAIVDGTLVSANVGAGTAQGYRARSSGSVAARSATTVATTLTVDMKTPDNGANYGNGGAGGPAFAMGTTTNSAYTPHTIDIIGSAGGSGANGFVCITYME